MEAIPTAQARNQIIQALLICVFLGTLITRGARAFAQGEVTLGAGEKVWLRLDKDLSTKTAQVGDRLEAELESPRVGKDTRVVGTVVAVRAANKAQRIPARLKLSFNQIVLADGRKIPMEGSVEMNGMGSPPNAWGAGVLIGALATGAGGALIGDAVNGAKGAGTGIVVGTGAGGVLMAALLRSNWKDVRIQKGRRFAVELKQDVHLPIAPTPKP